MTTPNGLRVFMNKSKLKMSFRKIKAFNNSERNCTDVVNSVRLAFVPLSRSTYIQNSGWEIPI